MGPRDLFLAHRIRAHGGRWSLRVVLEARRVDLPISLACALIEHESGWANVFGHDPTIFVGAGTVTKTKYLTYRAARGTTKCQGVGPCQLTYWGFQDKADRYGGCWKPRYNIRVAFEVLAANIRQYGTHGGVKSYNGSGPAAERYANTVLARRNVWHNWLGGK